MAYNFNFPSNYQPYYQQTQMSSNLIWVQGEAGAKSYMVAPNTTVQLWDSEAQVIYLKSADASGMPSIKTLDYTIRELPSQTHENAAEERFATKEDISTLEAEIAEIRKELKHGKPAVSNDRKSDK